MRKLLTLALPLALAGITAPADAGEGDFIGEVMTFAGTFCPRGYLEANGQLLNLPENPALFSLYGTNFGGDGRNTFGVPDMMSTAPQGIMYCISFIGIFPSRP